MPAMVTHEELAGLVRDVNLSLAKMAEDQAKRNAEREASFAEWQKSMQESAAEREASFAKWQKSMQENIGGLNNSLGDMAEAIFVNLADKFNSELGFNFPRIADRGIAFRDRDRRLIAEIDRFYENGDSVLAAEVKARLREDHVDGHIERLKKIAVFLKGEGKEKKVIGAVAGYIVPESVMNYAHGNGLYVLVQNGDSVSIAARPPDFMERAWNRPG